MKTLRWIYARTVFPITLLWNLFNARLLKRWNWWDRVDEAVIIGALPFASQVASLKSLGVVAVVNTCEEYAGPAAAYQKAAIEQLRIPTIDFTPPSLEDVDRAMEFMDRAAARGSIYVHCKAGRARSATIVVCWLIHSRGMTPAEAQSHLLSCRKHVNPHIAERTVVTHFFERSQAESDSSQKA